MDNLSGKFNGNWTKIGTTYEIEGWDFDVSIENLGNNKIDVGILIQHCDNIPQQKLNDLCVDRKQTYTGYNLVLDNMKNLDELLKLLGTPKLILI